MWWYLKTDMLEGTFIWRVQNFFLVAIKQFIRKTIVQAVLFVFDLASCFGGPFAPLFALVVQMVICSRLIFSRRLEYCLILAGSSGLLLPCKSELFMPM